MIIKRRDLLRFGVLVSGVPTVAGTFSSFAAAVTDSNGIVGNKTFSVTITAGMTKLNGAFTGVGTLIVHEEQRQ